MSARLIHDLHAGISRRDWSAVEAASNRLRDDVQQTISTLAGAGIGSLPNDYPLPRLAERLEADRRERVEQCERMATDWADFCETMGATWDTQEAVAAQLRARGNKQRALIETLSKTLSAVKTWAEKRCPCDNDEPNPCPLCGASVENLEACKAVDQTFPPNIKRDIFAALAAAKEQSA